MNSASRRTRSASRADSSSARRPASSLWASRRSAASRCKRAFAALVPRLDVPAPLVLRLLDQSDVGVGFDQLDPPLDEFPILGWPVGREIRNGRRLMALEPGRLELACAIRRARTNLEGALAELRGGVVRSIVALLSIRPYNRVRLPVEFFLKRNHLLEKRLAHRDGLESAWARSNRSNQRSHCHTGTVALAHPMAV